MTKPDKRHIGALSLIVATTTVLAACTSSDSRETSAPVTVTETVVGTTPAPTSSTTTKQSTCNAPVVAIDPGHNGVEVSDFDATTGIAMRDYPNGAEDADVLAVAKAAKRRLESDGYSVVLLKENVADSVTYRERVTRAEKAGAAIGVSLHTYTDDHRVFDQRVGAFREGTGPDGRLTRITFTNAATAKKSHSMSVAFAKARSEVEGRSVTVAQNSFDGRAPLWSGNIPVIALLADQTPWVYNEFGTPSGGGANPIGAAARRQYTDSVVAGVKAAVPRCR